jgi:alpha-aminoadipic semialdehyde synthase
MNVSNRIGIRREDKNKWERRSPLIPSHVRELIQEHSLEVVLQPSELRIFQDEEYKQEGALIEESLGSCPVIFAVKEIPDHFFEEEKTYVFFSHTIKGQPLNMPMLKRMVELRCTLIDYERIVDETGQRLVFFGNQAGQAGMIDTLWGLGERLESEGFETSFSFLEKAHRYESLVEAMEKIREVGWQIHEKGLDPSLVPFICGFSGYGRVSEGAQEIFDLLPVEEVSPESLHTFIQEGRYSTNRLYKVVLKEEHMVETIDPGHDFSLQDYYDHPEKYRGVFEAYLPDLSILVNCIYWAPQYPRLVTKKYLEQLWKSETSPRLKIIGDISCDVNGSIECTDYATEPDNPVFIYDPVEGKTSEGVKGRGVVVMAVDNLQAEISLESSLAFSRALKSLVPDIAAADYSGDLEDCLLPASVRKAMILFRGEFTPEYEYMKEFIS